MIEHILTKLAPEMVVAGLVLFVLLVLFALRRPEICFALGFPAYIFLGQLKNFWPVSNSAGAAVFPIAAMTGAILRGRQSHFGNCEKLVMGLAILMALSICYSPYPTYGRDKTILFCFMIVPIVIFPTHIITGMTSLRTVVLILALTLVVYVFTSLLALQQIGDIEGRVSGIHGVIQAGQFLGLGLVIAWLYIVLGRRRDPLKIFFFYLMLVAMVLLLMTGTRAAILAIFLTMIFAYWFAHVDWIERIFNQPHKTYVAIVISILIVVTSLLVLRSVLPHEVYDRYTSIEHFFSNFMPDEIRYWQYSAGRSLNYVSAVKAFMAHPVIGSGAGGYVDTFREYRRIPISEDGMAHIYPHNILLEFAAEQGTLGFVLVLCVLYLNLRMILKLRSAYQYEKQNMFLVCCCIYIYGLCVAMTSLDVPKMVILWWGMGLLLVANKICSTHLSIHPHAWVSRRHEH